MLHPVEDVMTRRPAPGDNQAHGPRLNRRELKVGGHTVHIFLDPSATVVKLSPGSPRYKLAPDYSWLAWLGLVAVFVVLFLLFKTK